GRLRVNIDRVEPDSGRYQSLAQRTAPPCDRMASASELTTLGLTTPSGIDVERLGHWLQAAMGVLQSAAHSSDFFERAAQTLGDGGGRDSGRVLLMENGVWKVAALKRKGMGSGSAESEWEASNRVLQLILDEKKTFWQVPESLEESKSLVGMKAVVAAPILD